MHRGHVKGGTNSFHESQGGNKITEIFEPECFSVRQGKLFTSCHDSRHLQANCVAGQHHPVEVHA